MQRSKVGASQPKHSQSPGAWSSSPSQAQGIVEYTGSQDGSLIHATSPRLLQVWGSGLSMHPMKPQCSGVSMGAHSPSLSPSPGTQGIVSPSIQPYTASHSGDSRQPERSSASQVVGRSTGTHTSSVKQPQPGPGMAQSTHTLRPCSSQRSSSSQASAGSSSHSKSVAQASQLRSSHVLTHSHTPVAGFLASMASAVHGRGAVVFCGASPQPARTAAATKTNQ